MTYQSIETTTPDRTELWDDPLGLNSFESEDQHDEDNIKPLPVIKIATNFLNAERVVETPKPKRTITNRIDLWDDPLGNGDSLIGKPDPEEEPPTESQSSNESQESIEIDLIAA